MAFGAVGAFGQGVPIEERLAKLVEGAMVTTGLRINIPPRLMEPTSLQIDKVDGVGVCEPSAKEKVLALQKAFAENASLRLTISAFAVYSRTSSGDVRSASADEPVLRSHIGECRYLYVSIR